jgi:hypothetical protein
MIRSAAVAIVAALLAACSTAPDATPGGTPAPTPDVSGQVIEDFYRWATDPQISYASVQEASVRTQGRSIELTSRYEFEAGNARASMRGRIAGQRLRLRFVLVDDFAYLRAAGSGWRQVEADSIQTGGAAIDAFQFLGARTDLEFEGPKKVHGKRLYELHNSEPLEYRTPAAGIADPTVTVTRLVVFVTSEGLPIQMRYHMEIDGQLPNGRSYFGEGDVTQTFRQHDKKFGIEPPRDFGPAT